jgi:hypothetical protein
LLWLATFCVSTTVVVVGVCLRVSERTLARHRQALCGADELRELRRQIARVPPTKNAEVGGPRPTPAAESGSADLQEEPSPDVRVEARVVREVLEAPSRPLAVLALNELTAEVGLGLEDARSLPPALARVALLSGTALGLVVTATGLGEGRGAESALWGGVCLGLALLGAAGCGAFGRAARSAAERRRDAARELMRALETRLPP